MTRARERIKRLERITQTDDPVTQEPLPPVFLEVCDGDTKDFEVVSAFVPCVGEFDREEGEASEAFVQRIEALSEQTKPADKMSMAELDEAIDRFKAAINDETPTRRWGMRRAIRGLT